MNEQKKINIILAVLFALLVISIFVIIADPTKKPNQYTYNGFVISRFRLQSAPDVVFHNVDLLVGNNKYSIPIRNNPADLESIKVSGLDKISWLSDIKESDNYDVTADKVYVTFDPTLSGGDLIIAGGEIVRALGSGQGGIYSKDVGGAFTRQLNGSSTTIKNCNDANSNTGIILIKLADSNKVYTENDCIVIEAASYPDMIKVSERFLLELLGVMQS